MASNNCCAGSKKQKMNNQPHGHSSNCNNYVHQNGHSSSNGHGLTNGGGGSMNGSSSEPSIANLEMCFFCFAVLDSELNNLGEPQSPHFTNDA